MKKKANGVYNADTGKMTDAELAEKLGHYQRASLIWSLIGMVGVVSGTVSFFAVQNAVLKTILVAVLLFGGICCVLFPGGNARKKLKALMQEQMNDFFREELEKAFGTEIHIPELCIDEPFVKMLELGEGKWEECKAEGFYEGIYHGVKFSAANIRLDHVYKKSIPHEGHETCIKQVFKGIVLRCKTRIDASLPVRAAARTERSPRGVATENETFDRNFCISAETATDVSCLFTQKFFELPEKLEQCADGHVCAFQWEKDTFSLAMETDFEFASVAGNIDFSDLDAVRRSYTESLWKTEKLLDILLENTELFERL